MQKKIIQISCCLAVFLLSLSLSGNAQSLTSEEIKTQLVKDWERAKTYTIEYLNAMPAGKYSFKPTDSVRTFAQQMLHITGGNYFLMSAAADQKPPSMRADLETSPGAQTKDSVMFFVNAGYDYCINTVKNSDINKWGEKKTLMKMEETRLSFMLKAFEHQTHHRGQTTIYLRMAGVRPPPEKLF
ncbi:MAG: DinB family protein [Chitinophagaceae bacterium]